MFLKLSKGLAGVEADILAGISRLPIGDKDRDGLRVIVRAYLAGIGLKSHRELAVRLGTQDTGRGAHMPFLV